MSRFLLAALLVCSIQAGILWAQDGSKKDEQSSPATHSHAAIAPRVLESVPPTLTEEERKKAGNNYAIAISLIVTEEGKPKDVKIVRGISPEIDKKAIEAVYQWKFAPGTKDDKPVATQITMEVGFQLVEK